MAAESKIVRAIRDRLAFERDLVLWRNNTGVRGGVRFGLCPGSADLVGVLAPTGRFFALEVKDPGGKVSEEQSKWMRDVNELGGYADVVRSVDDAVEALKEARRR